MFSTEVCPTRSRQRTLLVRRCNGSLPKATVAPTWCLRGSIRTKSNDVHRDTGQIRLYWYQPIRQLELLVSIGEPAAHAWASSAQRGKPPTKSPRTAYCVAAPLRVYRESGSKLMRSRRIHRFRRCTSPTKPSTTGRSVIRSVGSADWPNSARTLPGPCPARCFVVHYFRLTCPQPLEKAKLRQHQPC